MTTKTLKSLMAALAVLLPLCAYAHDVEVDGIYYNIDSTDKTATVTYMGSFNKSAVYTGDIVIPASFVNEGITYAVTSIGPEAFYYCSSLTTVSIPNSVTDIGDYAFYECRGLTAVNIPNSVTDIGAYAFEWCTSLTSVSIPNSATSIGAYAFCWCTRLTSMSIPNSVTSIGDYAFSDTPWYNNQPDGLIYAGRVAYKYKGTMPDNTSIIIKGGTISIGFSAFSGYNGLTSVTIPYSVTSIGGGAFSGCSGLTTVDIPNSVTSIGDGAFYECMA